MGRPEQQHEDVVGVEYRQEQQHSRLWVSPHVLIGELAQLQAPGHATQQQRGSQLAGHQESSKAAMIVFGYAVAYYSTVVVKTVHALVACAAVVCPCRSPDIAGSTVLFKPTTPHDRATLPGGEAGI